MGYLGFYGTKAAGVVASKLKAETGIGRLPCEGALAMALMVALLGLAARREAKTKLRLENMPVTDKAEADSFLRNFLY